MRFSLPALAVIALAQLASATTVLPRTQSCGKGTFWYDGKATCIPNGGVQGSTPPSGVQCPTDWAWGKTATTTSKCCLPNHQPPPSSPVPQCPKGWVWQSQLHHCSPPSPPTPHPPTPSKPAGHGGHYRRRASESRITLCPLGLKACPISGLVAGDYECLDTASEITSCGGCASEGKGQDCTSIEGAWNVGCERSSCLVYSCAGGFELSSDKKSCLPL